MKYLLDKCETERLSFRLLVKSDFEDWLPLFHAKDASRFLGMDLSKSPLDHCQTWFDKVLDRYENDRGGLNVLVDKSTDKMVGQCGLLVQIVDGVEELEVGYSILPQYWGKGYATEAAKFCKDEAFRRNYAENLISVVHIENIGSATVAQRNGMKIIKPEIDFMGMPVNVYGVSRAEWKLQQRK